MTLLLEYLLHRLRHLQLSAAKFICRMRSRKHPARREELVHRNVTQRNTWNAGVCGLGGRRHGVSIITALSQPSYKSSNTDAGTPTIAIVGRPNVGKSTLFNKLVGSRRAIVGDEPGITRDRLYGEAHWRGHDLRVVDTGGILPDDTDFIPSEIFRQDRVALDEAAAIVMVVDARTEFADPDLELARLLQRTGKP